MRKNVSIKFIDLMKKAIQKVMNDHFRMFNVYQHVALLDIALPYAIEMFDKLRGFLLLYKCNRYPRT